ncbi:MAG: thioredoxin family protein [Planctomycetes bacterium]|nr:thioredoxin family protein [Planctomycetota bacterium]
MTDEALESREDAGYGNSCAALLGVLLLLGGVGLALKPRFWDAVEADPAGPTPPSAPASPAGSPAETERAELSRRESPAEEARSPALLEHETPGVGLPFGSRLHLKNGRTIAGQVIRADAQQVVLKYAHGRLTLRRSDVLAIEELSEPERLQAQAQHERIEGRPDAAELLDQHARPSGPAPSYSGANAGPGEGGVVRELAPRFGPEREERGWPPGEVRWEVDADEALARAQRERKPVLAYVGSAGCPHCRRMAEGVWRDPEVVEASARQAVFLAINRRGVDSPNSAGAVRLGVRSYPQLFVLDPWGRPLELRSGDTHLTRVRVGRGKGSILGALRAAAARLPSRPAPLPELPGSLRGKVGEAGRDPSACRRAAAWGPVLERLSTPALIDLYRWETDAVTRVRVVSVLAGREGGPELGRVWAETLRDANDYVRWAGLDAIAQRRERGPSREVIALLERIAQPGATREQLQNPNNVMGDLIRTLERMPDPRAEEVLVWLVRRLELRNSNCAAAVRALSALWKAHPSAEIRRVLEEALDKTTDNAWAYEHFMTALLAGLSEVHGTDYTRLPREEAVRQARAARGGR